LLLTLECIEIYPIIDDSERDAFNEAQRERAKEGCLLLYTKPGKPLSQVSAMHISYFTIYVLSTT